MQTETAEGRRHHIIRQKRPNTYQKRPTTQQKRPTNTSEDADLDSRGVSASYCESSEWLPGLAGSRAGWPSISGESVCDAPAPASLSVTVPGLSAWAFWALLVDILKRCLLGVAVGGRAMCTGAPSFRGFPLPSTDGYFNTRWISFS